VFYNLYTTHRLKSHPRIPPMSKSVAFNVRICLSILSSRDYDSKSSTPTCLQNRTISFNVKTGKNQKGSNRSLVLLYFFVSKKFYNVGDIIINTGLKEDRG
jgi:hypothetical protein